MPDYEPDEPTPSNAPPKVEVAEPPKEPTTTPPDTYLVCWITPEDVQRFRNLWSLDKCRRWLKKYDLELQPVFKESLLGMLINSLDETTVVLRRYRSRMRRQQEHAPRYPRVECPNCAECFDVHDSNIVDE